MILRRDTLKTSHEVSVFHRMIQPYYSSNIIECMETANVA